MWLRGTPIMNGTLLKVGVLTSKTPVGPWEWVMHEDTLDPMHEVGGKYQYGDATLWKDERTGSAYVYWRARTDEAGFRGMQLDPSCTGVREETDTQIFTSPNREAPAFFQHDGHFYLWTSGTLGWSPVQAYVYKGPSALGPFNSSLGHGWHAYVKPAHFNTTHKYTVRDGYLSAGYDLINATETNFSAAEKLCTNTPACEGFTFKAYDPTPAPNETIKCSFKTVAKFVPEGDPEGLQPPPIAEPGDEGNRKEDGQPGVLSYGSQSTYILPNPAYTPHSTLAEFIYLADEWQPDTPNFGLYVWLPLFVDPNNSARIRVPWHDTWRLDTATSPFL